MLLLEYLFLWFLFYSFAGWVYESILVSVSERRLVNRGFLNGPICPIYGCGAVLAIVLLHDLHNPFAVFLISSIGACMLEYVTSWGMEKLFHARWWDYSHRRFNIQGRICLLGAIVFGLLGVLITDVIQPEVNRITQMIPLIPCNGAKTFSETNSATRCKTRSRIGRTPRRRFLPICRPLPHLS